MSDFEIRKSQAIYSYSTGALIDLSSGSIMTMTVDDWKGRSVRDRRLEKLFGVNEFKEPPVIDENSSVAKKKSQIYVTRFPNALSCVSCGRISFIDELNKIKGLFSQHTANINLKYFCPTCYDLSNNKNILAPTRFVIATVFGHMDDFPWDWYVHKNETKRQFRRNNGPNSCYDQKKGFHLQLFFRKGASLASLGITCECCKAQESLGEIFDKSLFNNLEDSYLSYIKFHMQKPWTNSNQLFDIRAGLQTPKDPEEKKEFYHRLSPRTLQRGASNTHFPVTHTGISIPSSNEVFTEEQIRIITAEGNKLIDYGLEPSSFINEKFISDIEDKTGLDHLRKAQLIKLFEVESEDPENYIVKEYNYLRSDTDGNDDDFYFENKVHKGSEYQNLDFVSQVSIVSKLRLLNILRGFTRLRPLSIDEVKFHNDPKSFNQRLLTEYKRINDVRNYPEKTKWLPAVEIKGEGIFIEFNVALIQNWIDSDLEISKRISTIQENFSKNLSEFDPFVEDEAYNFITPKYVLLHTISHLLIEEIAKSSGYTNASMSEIIYAKGEMAGILIYTSSSDAEGTLGGLSLMGKPSHLEPIFMNAFERSKWCSSDPVCIESSSGQGFMGVNLAACHSCAMLPETSCENMNRFLDRALLHGTLDNPNIGFLNNF